MSFHCDKHDSPQTTSKIAKSKLDKLERPFWEYPPQ